MAYGSQRTAAEDAVKGLTGVRNVNDEIAIDYGADSLDVTIGVEDALDRNALFYEVIDNIVITG